MKLLFNAINLRQTHPCRKLIGIQLIKARQLEIAICNGFLEANAADVLHSYYADWPLQGFPRFVIRRLLDKWSKRNDVFYMMAYANGAFAGFVLAQTVGPQPWRSLLKKPTIVLPFALLMWLRRRSDSLLRNAKLHHIPQVLNSPGKIFPAAPATFIDRKISGKTANVEFIYVAPGCRGKGVGGDLLNALTTELQKSEVEWLSAYISSVNQASISMFQKAGWEIFAIDSESLQAWSQVSSA